MATKTQAKNHMATLDEKTANGYIHGYTATERRRLQSQALFFEPIVHHALPFSEKKNLLEVGVGSGAQSQILLKNFKYLKLTGVDINPDQINEAQKLLESSPSAKQPNGKPRYELYQMDATHLDFPDHTFDSAFICFFLEHVSDPHKVLEEVKRTLHPRSPIVCHEAFNRFICMEPYLPYTERYWKAFNAYQIKLGGDPNVGVKLGNILHATGYSEIKVSFKTLLFDQRDPEALREYLQFFRNMLLSGAPILEKTGVITDTDILHMTDELNGLPDNPSAIAVITTIQARAYT